MRHDESTDVSIGSVSIESTLCRSCETPNAPEWQTGDGPVRLCPPCAALHGVGCP